MNAAIYLVFCLFYFVLSPLRRGAETKQQNQKGRVQFRLQLGTVKLKRFIFHF